MHKLLWFALLLSATTHAGEDTVSVYLDFEKAYMTNDVATFSPWLSEDYKFSQTLHVPGMGTDTREVTRGQLLDSMKSLGNPSSMPRSTADNINVESTGEGSFCASSSTQHDTFVSGKKYEEKEIRKVCFLKQEDTYKATTHNIDVHYRAL